MSFRGIDIRQADDRLIFEAFLLDIYGAPITGGTTNLKLYELQSDGTLKSYDWNSNTFKTTALTTENQAMTHRTGNNSTTNTGIWTYALTTLTGFTVGSIYYAAVSNTTAAPPNQLRKFQFGGSQEDVAVYAVATGTPTTTSINTGLTAADNFYNGCGIACLSGANKGVTRKVTTYTNSNGNLAFSGSGANADAAWPTAPAAGDVFAVFGRFGT